MNVTLCFCGAAVLLQCTLCHPTCCALTQSVCLFYLFSFHSTFFVSVACSTQSELRGRSNERVRVAHAPPLPSQPQRKAEFFYINPIQQNTTQPQLQIKLKTVFLLHHNKMQSPVGPCNPYGLSKMKKYDWLFQNVLFNKWKCHNKRINTKWNCVDEMVT